MTSFLRGNMGARAAFYKELAMLGVLTPNEIRRRENLDPIGPEGDQHLIPLNMGTLAKLATAPAPGAASP
jgi:phage portal protein BeeE